MPILKLANLSGYDLMVIDEIESGAIQFFYGFRHSESFEDFEHQSDNSHHIAFENLTFCFFIYFDDV